MSDPSKDAIFLMLGIERGDVFNKQLKVVDAAEAPAGRRPDLPLDPGAGPYRCENIRED